MINQQQLFQMYRQMTGSTVYQVKALPADNKGPVQKWQPARITEYAFMQEVK